MGNTKMKLINLAKIFLTLVVAINLLATCEAKKVKKHSAIPPRIGYILAGEGEVCSKSTPNFAPTKCAHPFVCKPMASDMHRGMTGMSSYCQRATGLIKPTVIDNVIPIPKPSIRIVKEGKVCYRSTPNFPITICEKGLKCQVRPGTQLGMTGGAKICQKPVWSHTGGNQIIRPSKPLIMTGGNGTALPPRWAYLGEVCRKSTPNFPKTKCDRGLECRVPDSTPRGMTGVASICQKPKITHYFSQTITRKPIEPIMLGGNGRGINPNLGQFQKNLVI